MKKLIILFALFSCLLPFSVYGAGICEVKCCDPSTGCEDLDPFCNNFATTDKIGYSELSSCSADQITAAKCGASDTAVCCCFRDKNITTQVSTKVTSLNFTPEISIPGSIFNNTAPIKIGTPIETNSGNVKTVTMNSDLLAKYIQAIYNYGLAIVSILAAIILMGGGLIWLTSGGDSSKVTKAKEMIIGSISGLVILFCAWIILNTVNPELLKLKPIETVVINKINMTCCEKSGKAEMSPDKDCKDKGGQSFPGYFVNTSGTGCELPGCCITKWSNGKINNCYNSVKSNCTDNFVNSNCATAIIGLVNAGLNDSTSPTPNIHSYCPDLCASKKDGERCYDSTNQYDNSFCYNGICWRGDGKKGEPCGNEGGLCGGYSNIVGLTSCKENRDKLGGRDCNGALLCCIGKQ